MDAIVLQQFLDGVTEGYAVVIVGMHALLLWAAATFRNPLAVVSWTFSLMLFVFSILFDLGIELMWLTLVLTAVLVGIGVIARWTR